MPRLRQDPIRVLFKMSYESHPTWFIKMAFCPKSHHIVTGNDMGTLSIWNFQMLFKKRDTVLANAAKCTLPKSIPELQAFYNEHMMNITFEAGYTVTIHHEPLKYPFRHFAFTPDGSYLLCLNENGILLRFKSNKAL